MSSIPITPKDDHFVSNPDLDILSHRPHKAAGLLYHAMTLLHSSRFGLIYFFLAAGPPWSAVLIDSQLPRWSCPAPSSRPLVRDLPRGEEYHADLTRCTSRFDAQLQVSLSVSGL